MGVLSALGQVNERVEETTETVLDNERLSVQDNVRAAHMRITGHDDEEEYARAASQDWEAAKDPVTSRAAGLTDNETLRGAGRGAESFADLFVGYPAQVAYGSATGANVTTDNPDHAHTDYSPDALDSLEGLVVAGPTGKAVSVGAKGASRATRAETVADGTMLGALARVGRNAASRASGGRVRSADDVATRTQTTNRATNSQTPENLRLPTETLPTGAATSKADTAADAGGGGWSWTQRALAGAGAGAVTLGAAGVIGGPTTYPDGYSVDKSYNGNPPADRIKQSDSDGNTKGFWVVVEADGKTVAYLTSNAGVRETTFPANHQPPFRSREQADAAYERWQAEVTNQGADTPAYEDPQEPAESAWGDGKTRASLGAGWHLFEQEHREKETSRWFVAGRHQSGEVIFLGTGGGVTTQPSPHPNREQALKAFQGWRQDAQAGNVTGPDPGADRPGESELRKLANNAGGTGGAGGGGLGAIGIVALGGGAAVIIALIMGVLL